MPSGSDIQVLCESIFLPCHHLQLAYLYPREFSEMSLFYQCHRLNVIIPLSRDCCTCVQCQPCGVHLLGSASDLQWQYIHFQSHLRDDWTIPKPICNWMIPKSICNQFHGIKGGICLLVVFSSASPCPIPQIPPMQTKNKYIRFKRAIRRLFPQLKLSPVLREMCPNTADYQETR